MITLRDELSRGPVLIAPTRFEELALRRGTRGRVAVERCGMGPARATARRSRLDRSLAPDRPVAVVGVAGGLSRDLRPGDVVVAQELAVSSIDDRVETAATPADAARLALGSAGEVADLLEAAGIAVHRRGVVSVPAVVRGAEQRLRLAAHGAVVDMESYWFGSLAARRPFAVVRVVLDTEDHELVSLSTAPGALRSYRALVAVSRVLATWSPVSVESSTFQEVGDR